MPTDFDQINGDFCKEYTPVHSCHNRAFDFNVWKLHKTFSRVKFCQLKMGMANFWQPPSAEIPLRPFH